MEASETRIELDAQYRALREGAALSTEPDRHVIAVRGSEAADYLQGQLTQDVERVEPGDGTYAALLDRKSHIQSDMRVTRTGAEEFLLDLEPLGFDRVLRHLSMYKIGRDAEIADESDAHVVIRLAGPAAGRVAGDVVLGGEGRNRQVRIDGAGVLAIATDVGLDLFVPAAEAGRVEAALLGAGAEPVDREALEIARVESGRPRIGHEMGEKTMPAEAGIVERAVSFEKGCYIGQETVARLHWRGRPNRLLRGLRLSAPAADGDPVMLGEREIGRIGTAVVSPAHGPIALAVLRREAEPGASVDVAGSGAVVTETPFG